MLETLNLFVVAALVAASLGAAELLARYKDRPLGLLSISGAWVYVAVNSAAAVGALTMVRAFGWQFGQSGSAATTLQVLAAGLGSAALFRSSLFLVKVGEGTVGVGPNLILESLLMSADRTVDRRQADRRIKLASDQMTGFDFAHRDALVSICLAAAVNVSTVDALALRESVVALADASHDDTGKNITLALLIIDVLGADVLESALDALRR